MVSIVVPAHDEEHGVSRCLESLVQQVGRDEEIIVVCNGCRDRTVELARAFEPQVAVEVLDEASKVAALNRGDELATQFPRLYVDADVELMAGTVEALVRALMSSAVQVAAPAVRHDLDGASWVVRCYYAIWQWLPSVRDDVVGRGVYAMSAEGRSAFGPFPAVTGDDHFVRDRFPPEKRAVVPEGTSVVMAPRNAGGLIRRKVRAHGGNVELDRRSTAGAARARQRSREWMHVVARRPRLLACVPLYVAIGIVARVLVQWQRLRGRGSRWERDDSSRSQPARLISSAESGRSGQAAG